VGIGRLVHGLGVQRSEDARRDHRGTADGERERTRAPAGRKQNIFNPPRVLEVAATRR
jgi:hypothetical protein